MPPRASASSNAGSLMPLCSHTTCRTAPRHPQALLINKVTRLRLAERQRPHAAVTLLCGRKHRPNDLLSAKASGHAHPGLCSEDGEAHSEVSLLTCKSALPVPPEHKHSPMHLQHKVQMARLGLGLDDVVQVRQEVFRPPEHIQHIQGPSRNVSHLRQTSFVFICLLSMQKPAGSCDFAQVWCTLLPASSCRSLYSSARHMMLTLSGHLAVYLLAKDTGHVRVVDGYGDDACARGLSADCTCLRSASRSQDWLLSARALCTGKRTCTAFATKWAGRSACLAHARGHTPVGISKIA